jgi:hypothetical protein
VNRGQSRVGIALFIQFKFFITLRLRIFAVAGVRFPV